MNQMPIKIIVGMVFICLMLVHTVGSYSTPGKAPIPSDVVIKESSAREDIHEEKSTNVRVYMPDSKKCPLEITKTITPKNHDDVCLIDSPFRVLVDIKCIEKDMKYVQILERVDPNMKITNKLKNNNFSGILNFYIIYTLKELANFHEGWHVNNKTYLDNHLENSEKAKIERYSNNTFFINVDNLNSKSRIIYWYDVVPQKSGILSTVTTVRMYGDYPDMDVLLDIPVNNHIPQFNIDLDFDKLEADVSDYIDLKYNIQYLGGSTDTVQVDIILYNSDEYIVEIIPNESGEYLYKDGYLENVTFELHELKEIPAKVRYKDDGVYTLPGISIKPRDSDEDVKDTIYTFKDDEIKVTRWRQRHIDEFTLMLSLLAALVGSLLYIGRQIKKIP